LKEPDEVVVHQVVLSVYSSLGNLISDDFVAKLKGVFERRNVVDQDGVINDESTLINCILVGCNGGCFDRVEFIVSEGSESALEFGFNIGVKTTWINLIKTILHRHKRIHVRTAVDIGEEGLEVSSLFNLVMELLKLNNFASNNINAHFGSFRHNRGSVLSFLVTKLVHLFDKGFAFISV
jgi:hypothetical protein